MLAVRRTECNITQRSWSEPEILDQLMLPMIAEGIALRASDIDVIWVHDPGWPRWRGGPMYYSRTQHARDSGRTSALGGAFPQVQKTPSADQVEPFVASPGVAGKVQI